MNVPPSPLRHDRATGIRLALELEWIRKLDKIYEKEKKTNKKKSVFTHLATWYSKLWYLREGKYMRQTLQFHLTLFVGHFLNYKKGGI